jgi:cytochrome c5
MKRRPFLRNANLIAAAMAAILSMTVLLAPPAAAQEPKQEPKQPPKDYLQRSLEIYEFRKAAPSGAERGQEIYYYKCWFCHNEFTQDIPKLEGLFKKANLISGDAVSDAAVKDKLRNGGPGMPAYKYVLNAADLTDLVSYLKEKCCWDSDNPPPNPRYRAR